jgi:hypothetical protein
MVMSLYNYKAPFSDHWLIPPEWDWDGSEIWLYESIRQHGCMGHYDHGVDRADTALRLYVCEDERYAGVDRPLSHPGHVAMSLFLR